MGNSQSFSVNTFKKFNFRDQTKDGYERIAMYAFLIYLVTDVEQDSTTFNVYANAATPDVELWHRDSIFLEKLNEVQQLKQNISLAEKKQLQNLLNDDLKTYIDDLKTFLKNRDDDEVNNLKVIKLHTGFQIQKVW